jgi:hypothetical protein
VALLLSLGAGVASTTSAADPEPLDVVVRAHSIQVAGKALKYESGGGPRAIADVRDVAHGYMYYTAYRVPTTGATRRPVTFVWNGGPGADSSFAAFIGRGPAPSRSRSAARQRGHLAHRDRPRVRRSDRHGGSVDPQAEYGEEFYRSTGATSLRWRNSFARGACFTKRRTPPRFLVGESWGARRAASVAYALQAAPGGRNRPDFGRMGLNREVRRRTHARRR